MDNLVVRKANLKDLKLLHEFEQGVIEAERPFDPTLRNEKITYYDLEQLMLSDDSRVVIVEHEQRIVASGYALKKPARHYLDHEFYSYLGFMYTHPDYRGKGVNALIVEALKEWSFSKGLTEIRLTVYQDNEPAIRAYEKMGFKKHIIEMRIA